MKTEKINVDNKEKIAVKIVGLKKKYRLGTIGGRTLQREIQSWWAKKRGKDDPNLRLGVNADLIGKEFIALDDINLTIKQGEAVGIIGANGAGKSTLLKILSQITAPTEGEIDIYGRIASMLEVGTGFHGEMTGRENIYMNGAILGMSKAEIDGCIDQIIEFSEVGEFIDTPVKRYSSGMFVKLAFSVAAHLNSEIMIMDEVLAVGDMAFQKKCLDKMREAAKREGRTVLYVSHNMNTIRSLCDRVVVLDKGHIIFDGETEKGISVYMDHCLNENEVDMDLAAKTHSGLEIDTGLLMKHLLLAEKILPVYDENEPLKMLITVNITKPIADVVFRITLRTDSDSGLGTAWTEKMSFEKTGEQIVEINMPLDMIAKGIFYASIGFYKVDELGMKFMLDHIVRAFKIEVLGKPNWNTGAFGHIKFPIFSKTDD